MPRDDDDDLYDGDFDFVDDDEFEGEAGEDESTEEADEEAKQKPVAKRKTAKKSPASAGASRKKPKAAPKKKPAKKKAPKKSKDEEVEEFDDDLLPDEVDESLTDESAEEAKGSDDRDASSDSDDQDGGPSDNAADEYGRVEPKADFVIHVYEHRKFHRTIDRAFTPEDADAFVTVFNKTGRPYGRFAVPARNDTKAKPELAP